MNLDEHFNTTGKGTEIKPKKKKGYKLFLFALLMAYAVGSVIQTTYTILINLI